MFLLEKIASLFLILQKSMFVVLWQNCSSFAIFDVVILPAGIFIPGAIFQFHFYVLVSEWKLSPI